MFILLTLFCAFIDAAQGSLMLVGRLLLWQLLIIIGIIKYKCVNWTGAILYLPFLIWILITLSWSPVPFYGIRTFFKYLLPFLLLLFVPNAVRHHQIVDKGIQLSYCVLIYFIVLHVLGVFHLGFLTSWFWVPLWWGPAIMDSFGVMLPLILVMYWSHFRMRRYLLPIPFLFLVPITGYPNRTCLVSLMCSAGCMALFKYKIKALPYLAMIAVFSISIVVFVPSIRHKMFVQSYTSDEVIDNLTEFDFSDVQSNSRFAVWDMLLRKFYDGHEWTGSGLGCQQQYMYYMMETSGTAGLAHSDYIQMLCDSGIISVILYVFASLGVIFHCFLMYNSQKMSLECRWSALIAGAGLTGLLGAMMTDNVVNYSMATLAYPYTFFGIALGLKRLGNPDENTMDEMRQFRRNVAQYGWRGLFGREKRYDEV